MVIDFAVKKKRFGFSSIEDREKEICAQMAFVMKVIFVKILKRETVGFYYYYYYLMKLCEYQSDVLYSRE